MREGLNDNAEYHQPRQLRKQIHLGSLKIKHTEGHTLSVKQPPEYLVDQFVVGAVVATMERRNRQSLLATSWSAFDDPPTADTRAESENSHAAHDRKSLPAHAFCSCQHSNVCQSTFLHLFSAHRSSGLCFCACAAQTFLTLWDWYSALALRFSTAVLGEESRCVSMHTHCAHHALRGFVVTEGTRSVRNCSLLSRRDDPEVFRDP